MVDNDKKIYESLNQNKMTEIKKPNLKTHLFLFSSISHKFILPFHGNGIEEVEKITWIL